MKILRGLSRVLTRSKACVHVTELPAAEALDFHEMPSPKCWPLLGTIPSFIAAGSTPHLHEYVNRRHEELGPIYREALGSPVDVVFVADPGEMRAVFTREGRYPKHVLPEAWLVYNQKYGCSRGLFFMDGEEWLHFRRIMNKLLLKSDCLQWLQDPCEQVAAAIVKRWESLLQGDKSTVIMNLEEELYRFSIDTMIAVLLGDKYAESKIALEHDVAYLASVVRLIFQNSAKLYVIPTALAAGLKLPVWKRFVQATDDGLNIANTLTKRIMSEYATGNGLISKMMAENIDSNYIKRIVADLILAAGDTTAYSMQWIIYLLAKHPEVQEKLINSNNAPLYPNLMKGIIREALRLYPVAPFLTRILPQDTIIGGYVVPEGTPVIMSLYTSSRNPKYFFQPEKFWPERWFRKNNRDFVGASPNATLPFAMGARSCIGRKIAENQMQTALKQITEKFRLEVEKDVEMVFRMVSVPSSQIGLKISVRD